MALIKDAAFSDPIIIDLMEAHSSAPHQYDLPFYYNGQLTETNFDLSAYEMSRKPLGKNNGYQYLWEVGKGKAQNGTAKITWLLDQKFYSVTSSVPPGTEVIFVEIGANDPNFNLRREPAFIFRAKENAGVSFASVIEPHGEYNPTLEFTADSHSNIKSVEHFASDDDQLVLVTTKSGKTVALGIADSADETTSHNVLVNGTMMTWTGPYHLFGSERTVNQNGE